MKRRKNRKNQNEDVWTEEQYEEYMAGIYGLKFVAGFTESGVPYGIPEDEDDFNEITKRDKNDDELPF